MSGVAWKSRGQGAPLVFLHGVGGGAESWDGQLARFGQSHRALAWDMPGYGASDPVEPADFPAWVAALAGALDALGLARVTLVGHSIGGMIAQAFVAAHPQRVARLVLSATSPAFGNPDGEFQRDFLAARIGPLDRGRSMADLAAAFVPDLMGPAAPAEARAAAMATMARVRPGTYRAAMAALTRFEMRDRLPAIACPTLLMAGAADASAPLKVMERMAARIPGAQLAVLPGVGHLANLEAPAAFDAALAAFLERTEGSL